MNKHYLLLVIIALAILTAAFYFARHMNIGNQHPPTNWPWSNEWARPMALGQPLALINPRPQLPMEEDSPLEEVLPETPPEAITASTYRKAIALSQQHNRPVLAFFTANWCIYCVKMKKESLDNADVKEAMKKYIFVMVDTDMSENAEVVRKFGIRSLPSNVVLDAQERMLKQQAGYMEASTYAKWLAD